MAITTKGKNFYKDGKKICLAGDHTWNTVHSIAGEKIGLDKITGNFTRLWTLETKGAEFATSRWGSETSGVAKISNLPWKKDGSLNKTYYKVLEKTVRTAEKKDMITGVVLFEGTFPYFPKGWDNHIFNGLGPSSHEYVHTKGPWNKFQRAHVKEVIETLEPYDNVIYEVGNELHRNSISWFQGKVVEWIKKWTNKPVGVSYATGMKPSLGRSQDWLLNQNADWIAPAGLAKVPGFSGPQVFDTDHSWPLYGNVSGLGAAWSAGRPLWVMNGFNGTMLKNQNSLSSDLAFIRNIINT